MSSILNLLKNPLVIAGIIATAIAIPTAIHNSEEPPQPDFIADMREGFASFEVQFTDESTGDVISWEWDFDNDGTVDSTERNPSYTYNNSGTYTVSLSVPGEGGPITETKNAYIVVRRAGIGPVQPLEWNAPQASENLTYGPGAVSPPEWDPSQGTANLTHDPGAVSPLELIQPWAEFSAAPRYGNAPLEAHFTDESTDNPISWIWDFDNDGNVDSWEQNPSHNYVNPGTYTVFLSVSAGDMTWSIETKTDYIVVLSPTHADFYSSKTYGNIPLEESILYLYGGR
jgi:PKD repeat protein